MPVALCAPTWAVPWPTRGHPGAACAAFGPSLGHAAGRRLDRLLALDRKANPHPQRASALPVRGQRQVDLLPGSSRSLDRKPTSTMTVAAGKGAKMAGRKGPAARLRYGHSQDVKERGAGGRCLCITLSSCRTATSLPCGNGTSEWRSPGNRLSQLQSPDHDFRCARSCQEKSSRNTRGRAVFFS